MGSEPRSLSTNSRASATNFWAHSGVLPTQRDRRPCRFMMCCTGTSSELPEEQSVVGTDDGADHDDVRALRRRGDLRPRGDVHRDELVPRVGVGRLGRGGAAALVVVVAALVLGLVAPVRPVDNVGDPQGVAARAVAPVDGHVAAEAADNVRPQHAARPQDEYLVSNG